jgi:glycosyltransferase involved in cell wall biosynthesis
VGAGTYCDPPAAADQERSPVIHVLLTHPFFWPHVARGAEREVHDAGMRLVERGHRVDLVTGQPKGLTSTADVDGIHVRYARTPLPRALERRGWRREGTFGAVAALGAAASSADVVASFLYADAYGAALASRLPLPKRRNRPVVLKLTGAVPLATVADKPVEEALLRRALDTASEIWVNSAFAAESMADWGHPMHVVPAGLDERTFRPVAERSPHPLVLCTAAPDEPRKRLVDLLDAWPLILEGLPGAELAIAQHTDDGTRSRLLERVPAEHRRSIRFTGRLDGDDLAAHYSRAWVAVAPAVYEALGLATVEALACGTPVAGCDSGATPELLDQPGTGVLFRPADPTSLAEAVVAASARAQEPDVRERCRRAALRYAWPGIIDEIEQRLTALVESPR